MHTLGNKVISTRGWGSLDVCYGKSGEEPRSGGTFLEYPKEMGMPELQQQIESVILSFNKLNKTSNKATSLIKKQNCSKA